MIDEGLILRNTVEAVTEDEIKDLLSSGKATAYCGYEVSGAVHAGHMVTATKLLDMQAAGVEVKILFADVHTMLNRKGGGEWLEEVVTYWTECFKGLGLEGAEYVRGSDFQFEKGYVSDVLKLAQNVTMNRALRSMQEIARDIENARVSQTVYPLMQVVDVKALDVDIAYGGIEQRKIHMLARETLPGLGYKKPACIHTPLICSLKGPDSKMSSSKPETIVAVDEEPESIKKKIGGAYCPPETEGNPVLDICRLLLFPRKDVLTVERPQKYGGEAEYTDYGELEADYSSGKLHPADLKNTAAKELADALAPVRERLQEKGIKNPGTAQQKI